MSLVAVSFPPPLYRSTHRSSVTCRLATDYANLLHLFPRFMNIPQRPSYSCIVVVVLILSAALKRRKDEEVDDDE